MYFDFNKFEKNFCSIYRIKITLSGYIKKNLITFYQWLTYQVIINIVKIKFEKKFVLFGSLINCKKKQNITLGNNNTSNLLYTTHTASYLLSSSKQESPTAKK